jgi:hypothetical protein
MTTNIVDKDGNSIAAADATVPSDRHFRMHGHYLDQQ